MIAFPDSPGFLLRGRRTRHKLYSQVRSRSNQQQTALVGDSLSPILRDRVWVETRWRESMLRCENLSVQGMLA